MEATGEVGKDQAEAAQGQKVMVSIVCLACLCNSDSTWAQEDSKWRLENRGMRVINWFLRRTQAYKHALNKFYKRFL